MLSNDTANDRPGLEEVCAVLCKIHDPLVMQTFLDEIFTSSERRDLALRWELMKRLKQGTPQRQIAKELGISLCKITRGAKILKQDHSISKHYLNTGEKDESKNPT